MIQFYNSLTKKKENFVPIKKGKVSIYTCGPTVYDNAHIGNYGVKDDEIESDSIKIAGLICKNLNYDY